MRISTLLIRLGVFLIAAALCLGSARLAVMALEARSVVAVQEALLDADHGWASVQGDGLQIIIEGEAPSEAMRFRAISAAGTVVDSSRVIDNMQVAESEIDTAPNFAIEFLRNESGISMIGLMPASSDREAVLEKITDLAAGGSVADLLNSSAYTAPPKWSQTLNYALRALALLPRSKLSMSAGHLEIRAISASEEQREAWRRDLLRLAPMGVDVSLNISAPRPVVTPFTVRFVKDEAGARFDACAADNEAGQAQILAAARAAGAGEEAECVLALGVPSRTWPAAVSRALGAVSDLGGGTLTFADGDVHLIALEGTDPARFDEVIGRLQNELPDVFSLDAELPLPPDPEAEGPPEFAATLSDEGAAQLTGRIADALMNSTAESYAKARFGEGKVSMGTRILATGLPADWSRRVLAGVEALSHLHHGEVKVTPERVSVSGVAGAKEARADISRMLLEKLGKDAGMEINITYDETLDPIAALPSPEECLGRIVTLNEAGKISFDPGSSNIAAAALATVNGIADVLKACPELPLQIAGYTDSQGSEQMNLRLSEQRARSVLDALRLRRVPTRSFAAVGFGKENPIADNGTEAGREANRRIEFSLIAAEAGEEAAPDQPAPTEESQSNEQN